MADVTIVNNSDQKVGVRLDESTDRGRDMLEHYKKMYRLGEFKSLKVKPTPEPDAGVPIEDDEELTEDDESTEVEKPAEVEKPRRTTRVKTSQS